MLINGERALAYLVVIDEIKPIPNYDRVEHTRVGGWWCIVQKGQFNVGDKALYIEVDSKVPSNDKRFAFLEKRHYKVKTLRMCKVYSQGLIMPLDEFPELKDKEIHEDVTKLLGIRYSVEEDNVRKAKSNPNAKYNNMAARHKKLAKKSWFRWLMKRPWGRELLFVFFGRKKDTPKQFPSWIKKTDEDRIENRLWMLEDKEPYVKAEKIDGCFDYHTSIRTNEGHLTIGKIVNKKMPVLVASYNENKDIVEYKRILDYHKIKISNPVLKIEVGYRGHGNRSKYITCTNNHEFYTPGGWKQAKELNPGDIVYHYAERFPYEIKQLIFGSLLGDASMNANDKNGEYRCVHFTQSDKQIGYFNYKKNILGKYCLGERDRISGYGSLMHDMHTTTNLDINHMLNDYCIKDGHKFVTEDWCNLIDPMGLAFWYMDDGSISNRENENLSCRINISTNGFSLEENQTLVDMLARFNIIATIGDKETYKGYTLILDAKNTEKFCSLIAPYVCEDMKYKLPKKYQDMPCCYENMSFDEEQCIVEVDIKSIKHVDDHKEYFYDLTIEDNHNYFAQSILVHNCSSTFFIDTTKRKPEFGVCSRNVRQVDENQENYVSNVGNCGNVYWEMAFKYNIKDALISIANDYGYDRVVLQGEIYGSDVQGNKYKLNERRFAAFNLVLDGVRLGSVQAKEILDKYNIPFVPIVDAEYILPDADDFEAFKESADGNSVINNSVLREGFVYRSQDGQKSFKNVSRKFLLKNKE